MKVEVSRAVEREGLLSEAEVVRLLAACSERAPTGVRNRALIALFYCSGLRLGEALALRPSDVELASGSVDVARQPQRRAHVFPSAHPYVETWLELRARLGPAPEAPLFCTLRGEPLSGAYVRALLARLGARARIGKRVHAHGLRRACAARLARAGLAPAAMAAQLGHAETRSTARALRQPGFVRVAHRVTRIEQVSWSLSPAPGAVRALIRMDERAPRSPAAREAIVVRRWRPVEL